MKTYNILDFGAVSSSDKLQNKAIQAALDACRENGGKVIIPKGIFRISSVRMWSDTTLYLEEGAWLIGSDYSEDYEVYEVPEDVKLHTDMQLISQYYNDKPWDTYYRAMISVYGGKNISIIGEKDSHIDGNDCTDPNGEEGYRGPHGMMLTNIENLTLADIQLRTAATSCTRSIPARI